MNFSDLAVRSMLLTLAVLAIGWLLRNRHASVRHTIYATSFIALFLLPLFWISIPGPSLAVPSFPVALQQGPTVSIPPPQADAVAAQATSAAVDPASDPVPWDTVGFRALWAVWLAGVLILLSKLGLQLGTLARLARHSRRLEVDGFPNYEVRTNPEIQVPCVAWIGRPVILVPAAFETWPVERVRSVILHESAHIRRADWFTQIAGCLACALYWPNPLVWIIQRRSLNSAELAADDCVLQAGITPAQYAEDLLLVARSMPGNSPALSLPMALKTDVGKRIERVLNERRRRGSVSVLVHLAAGCITAAIAVPVASFILEQRQADPNSPYADVRDGGTVPAAKMNKFTAVLSDNRSVQLVQISQLLDNGTYRSWGPDGTPIPQSAAIPDYFKQKSEQILRFYFRFTSPALNKDEIEAAMVPGDGVPLWAPAVTIFDNKVIATDKPGEYLLMSLLSVPKLGGLGSYSFKLADGPSAVAAYQDLPDGALENPGGVANLKISQKSKGSEPDHYKENLALANAGKPIPKENLSFHMHDVPLIGVAYDLPKIPMDRSLSIRALTKDGQQVKPWYGYYGAISGGAGQAPATSGLYAKEDGVQRIEIRSRHLYAANILGVHLSPNGK